MFPSVLGSPSRSRDGAPGPASEVDLVVPQPRRTLKHVQVREYVRRLAEQAEPGTLTPSERDLVSRFGVARMTVRQAMDSLVAEGVIERIPGRGTFVAQRSTRRALAGFSQDMIRRGITPDSRTLLLRPEAAGPGVARALEIDEGAPVVHWKRLRSGDGVPLCIESNFLSEAQLPGFGQHGVPNSLFAALGQRGLRPDWAEYSVTAQSATQDEADLLQVAVGDPLLRVSSRVRSHGAAVLVSTSVFRADRYTMWMQVDDARG